MRSRRRMRAMRSRRRMRALALAGCATAWLAAAPPASAQEWLDLGVSRQAFGVDSVDVDVEYMDGELSVAPAPEGLLYDIRFHYDASRFEPVREWSEEAGRGELDVGLDLLDSDEDFHMDMDGDHSGTLGVRLGTSVPIDLHISTGATAAELELGGIPLTAFELETGASDTDLRFGTPNPVPMSTLTIEAGAASLNAEKLANARAAEYRFEGGVGDVTLEFGGEWRRDAVAMIEMGMGSLHLRVPRDLGIRLLEDTFLVSVDTPDFAQVGDAWQSPNWESAERRLEIRIDAAFGAIEIDYLD